MLEHNFLPQSVDVWHDRAVFHFLTEPPQRHAYVAQLLRALKPGGFAIVGAFGPEGPARCSGLAVARYSSDKLHNEFGVQFRLLDHSINLHTTPWGATQQFVYCFCRLEQQIVMPRACEAAPVDFPPEAEGPFATSPHLSTRRT